LSSSLTKIVKIGAELLEMWDHSLNGSSDSVNGDLQFLWGLANFNPPTKSILLNRLKKIGTVDYIRDGTSYTKFGRNPFIGGFWQMGEV